MDSPVPLTFTGAAHEYHEYFCSFCKKLSETGRKIKFNLFWYSQCAFSDMASWVSCVVVHDVVHTCLGTEQKCTQLHFHWKEQINVEYFLKKNQLQTNKQKKNIPTLHVPPFITRATFYKKKKYEADATYSKNTCI